jgi:hypothetical protein
LSLAYTDSEQSTTASLLLSTVNHVDFPGYVLPPSASLPSSLAYTDFGHSPSASLLLGPANHAGFSSFVPPPSASLCLSLADSEQSPSSGLLRSPFNLSDLSGLAYIGYHSHANEPSLLQHQLNHGGIFPEDFPNSALFN